MVTWAEAQSNNLPVSPDVVKEVRAKPYNSGKDSWEDYGKYRPTYPPQVFEALLDYHNRSTSDRSLACDYGCGPGSCEAWLLQHFDQVIASDTGAGQIAKAKELFHDNDRVTFLVHSADEPIQSIKDGSASLVTAATAAHWFDMVKWPAEAARVLRPGGVLAWFGYAYPSISNNLEADKLLLDFQTRFWNTIALADGSMAKLDHIWRNHGGAQHVHLPTEQWSDYRKILWDQLPPGHVFLHDHLTNRDFEPSDAPIEHRPPAIVWKDSTIEDWEKMMRTLGGQWQPFETLSEWTETKQKIKDLTGNRLDLAWPVHISLATRR